MKTSVTKQTIKECFQTLTDEQLQQYHLTHDYFTGRPLATPMTPREDNVADASTQRKQRNLSRLNEVLYPTPTLGSVLGDSLAALKLDQQQPSSSQSTFEKPSEDLLNRVKTWFDQFQTDGLESLLPAQAEQLSDANLAVIKQGFARNTLLIQNVCMLSPFWIRSPLDWDAAGKSDLLTHLFVEYDAPAFLKPCWSKVADEENVRWLLCFLIYAQGGSLKALAKYFGWTTVSKKLWHELFNCPANMPPQSTVLFAEFKRLGGWNEDFTILMQNEAYVVDLLDPISEEGRDFWYDTCRWTISYQAELAPEQTRKVLWWARHQLTEQARHGERYRLQGRSLNKVQESIAEYDREQEAIAHARARMAERARQVSMARNEESDRMRREYLEMLEEQRIARAVENHFHYHYEDIDATWKSRGWNWSTLAHGKKWRFRELTSSAELIAEGNAMAHCVGGYSLACVDGDSAIFSLQDQVGRKATIEVNPKKKHVVQLQGYLNAETSKSIQSVVKTWLEVIVK